MNGFKVNGVWAFLGVALFLVLVYLVLAHASATVSVGNTAFSGLTNLFTTLQGRTVSSGGKAA